MNGLRSAVLLGLFACALLSACGAPDDPHKTYPPLTSTSAQPGFNFATSRPVEVRISSAKQGAISISSADGKLIFSGRLGPGTPLRLKLPLDARDEKLLAALRADGVVRSVDLPIVAGVAGYAFN